MESQRHFLGLTNTAEEPVNDTFAFLLSAAPINPSPPNAPMPLVPSICDYDLAFCKLQPDIEPYPNLLELHQDAFPDCGQIQLLPTFGEGYDLELTSSHNIRDPLNFSAIPSANVESVPQQPVTTRRKVERLGNREPVKLGIHTEIARDLPQDRPYRSLKIAMGAFNSVAEPCGFPFASSYNLGLQPPAMDQVARKAGHGCSCKKSRCLKLYCECFATEGYCRGCHCIDCYNHESYKDQITTLRRSIIA